MELFLFCIGRAVTQNSAELKNDSPEETEKSNVAHK